MMKVDRQLVYREEHMSLLLEPPTIPGGPAFLEIRVTDAHYAEEITWETGVALIFMASTPRGFWANMSIALVDGVKLWVGNSMLPPTHMLQERFRDR